MAELNSDLSLKTSYAWGLDLSGSIQGAGGVGGLLFAVYYSPSTEVYFPAYDGNGNVMALCKGSDGSWVAQYEYGPFGELIRATGLMAKTNFFRFSTKYQDEETGLVYYGFRFYCPSLGRWLSRDPIEENGWKNLYGFVINNSINNYDILGLSDCCTCGPDVTKALNKVLGEITTSFGNWPYQEKCNACLEITGLGPNGKAGASKAWEIDELGYSTPTVEQSIKYNNPLSRGGCEKCKYTVAFEGKCFSAAQLNYVMWGHMFKLCGNYFNVFGVSPYSEDMAVTGVLQWKKSQYNQRSNNPEVQQAVDSTRYGYSGKSLTHDLKDCTVLKDNVFNGSFSWTWEPNKKRKQYEMKP